MTKVTSGGEGFNILSEKKNHVSQNPALLSTSEKAHRKVTSAENPEVTAVSKKQIEKTAEKGTVAQTPPPALHKQMKRSFAPHSYPLLKLAEEEHQYNLKVLSNSYENLAQASTNPILDQQSSDPLFFQKEIKKYENLFEQAPSSSASSGLSHHLECLRKSRDSAFVLKRVKQHNMSEEKIRQKFKYFAMQVHGQLAQLTDKQMIDTTERFQAALFNADFSLIEVFATSILNNAKAPDTLKKLASTIEAYCQKQTVTNLWLKTRLESDDLLALGKDIRDVPRSVTSQIQKRLSKEPHSFSDRMKTVPEKVEMFTNSVSTSLVNQLASKQASALNHILQSLPLKAKIEHLLEHYSSQLTAQEVEGLKESLMEIEALTCEIKVTALLDNNQFEDALDVLRSPEFRVVDFRKHLGPLFAVIEYMGMNFSSDVRVRATLEMTRSFLGMTIEESKDVAVNQLKQWHQQLNQGLQDVVFLESIAITKNMADTLVAFAVTKLPQFSKYKEAILKTAEKLNVPAVGEKQMVENMIIAMRRNDVYYRKFDPVTKEDEIHFLLSDGFEKMNEHMHNTILNYEIVHNEETESQNAYNEILADYNTEKKKQEQLQKALDEVDKPKIDLEQLVDELDSDLQSEFELYLESWRQKGEALKAEINVMEKFVLEFEKKGSDPDLEWQVPEDLSEGFKNKVNESLRSQGFDDKVENLNYDLRQMQKSYKTHLYKEGTTNLYDWLKARMAQGGITGLTSKLHAAKKRVADYKTQEKKLKATLADVDNAIKEGKVFYADVFVYGSKVLQSTLNSCDDQIGKLKSSSSSTHSISKKIAIQKEIGELENQKKILKKAIKHNYFDSNKLEKANGLLILETLRCFAPQHVAKGFMGIASVIDPTKGMIKVEF